jgi:predicted DNA-binding transcriptional regulator YafY
MPRSTDTQKAERLNAAHGLLARGTSMAEAATLLSREFGLSRRQAYRYLGEAETIGHAVPVGEPAVAITLKIPGDVARDLRAYSAASGVTMGAIVARAIVAFLAAQSRHG